MRISIEIDAGILSEVQELTGENAKGPALTKAVEEFVKRRKAATFGKMIREGYFDYPDVSATDERILNPLPRL
jgi:hypothetical protein